jgi:hypothetical protein
MYDDSGAFVVHVRDEVAASIPADMVATATGGPQRDEENRAGTLLRM